MLPPNQPANMFNMVRNIAQRRVFRLLSRPTVYKLRVEINHNNAISSLNEIQDIIRDISRVWANRESCSNQLSNTTAVQKLLTPTNG